MKFIQAMAAAALCVTPLCASAEEPAPVPMQMTAVVHIHTPPAVSDAITALAHACNEWPGTVVQIPDRPPIPPAQPRADGDADGDANTICQFVTSPAPWHGMLPAIETFGMLIVIVMSALFIAGVHRIPGTLARLVRRGARRLSTSA